MKRSVSHTEEMRWSLILVITMAFWASGYVFIKPVSSELPPFLLAFFRFFFASLVLIPFLKRKEQFAIPGRQDWLKLLLLSIATVFPTVILALVLDSTPISISSILFNTNPLWVVLLAPFFIKESFSFKKLIALVIGTLGTVVVILNGQSIWGLLQSSTIINSGLLLVGSVTIALQTIAIKAFIKKYGGLYIATITACLGALLLLLCSLVSGEITVLPSVSLKALFFSLLLGIFGTALPYLIWMSSLRHLKAGVSATFKLLIPIFSAVFGVIIFQETLTTWIVGGMALTSIGVYVVQAKNE